MLSKLYITRLLDMILSAPVEALVQRELDHLQGPVLQLGQPGAITDHPGHGLGDTGPGQLQLVILVCIGQCCLTH